MWDHITVNIHIVWDVALWRVRAAWLEDLESEPVWLESEGQLPVNGDGPATLLRRVIDAAGAGRVRGV